jgi:hypothetical protein
MKRFLSIAVPLAVAAGAGYAAYRFCFRPRATRHVPVLPSDAQVTRRVKVSLQRAGAALDDLHVRVLDGMVMVRGEVSAAERDTILRAILLVPGVRGVRNELDVGGGTADPDLAVQSPPWKSARPQSP